ncbi:hypothetical protein TNCV_1549981 [Trichonephila clavipes]|nr:hypothetical protein TNCV_1549981 [Trichonephila clavipes]
MILQGRESTSNKLMSSWIQDHTRESVNIIPKNIISQIKGYHNVEYIKTKIAIINGEIECNQLASLDKNNALREIKLRLSYLQGIITTMSVIAHQTEKEWISANEKSRQRMSQTQAEGAAKQHAARLEDAHLRAHHSCFTISERC